MHSLADHSNAHRDFLQNWETHGARLMERSGDLEWYKDGGHDVKNNPVLKAALEEVRDCYFLLLQQKVNLLSTRPANEELIAQVDEQFIALTDDCRDRLQKDGYGFSHEEQQKIIAAAGCNERLLKPAKAINYADAGLLTGTLIKCTISSYMPLVKAPWVDRYLVPGSEGIPSRNGWSCREAHQRARQAGQLIGPTP